MKEILKNIDRKREILIKLLKSNNNKQLMNKWLKSELTYTSNAIEGNTLTRKETELVIEENLTSSSKPFVFYQEAINHAKAFEKVLEVIETNSKISKNIILNLHKIILTGIDDNNAGFYRDCMVRISGSRVILPNPMKVPTLIDDFFKWLNEQNLSNPTVAIEAHLKFVSIHPFVDGNGRCARLLMNLILLKAGYPPIIIRPIDRKRYLNNIEKAQLTQNVENYNLFMLTALNRSINVLIDLIDTEKEQIPVNNLLTIAKFANLVELPVSTIRYWVKTEKIKPNSYTESGYMLFDKKQIEEIKGLKKLR